MLGRRLVGFCLGVQGEISGFVIYAGERAKLSSSSMDVSGVSLMLSNYS